MAPEVNNGIKMEVGIEDCMHIEFEYNKARYHLKDVIIGKVFFILVRIKIKVLFCFSLFLNFWCYSFFFFLLTPNKSQTKHKTQTKPKQNPNKTKNKTNKTNNKQKTNKKQTIEHGTFFD